MIRLNAHARGQDCVQQCIVNLCSQADIFAPTGPFDIVQIFVSNAQRAVPPSVLKIVASAILNWTFIDQLRVEIEVGPYSPNTLSLAELTELSITVQMSSLTLDGMTTNAGLRKSLSADPGSHFERET